MALRYLLKKEFLQVLRNKAMLPLIFVMPVVQLIILPLAANYEVKNIRIAVVDHDHSTISRRLIDKIPASGYFQLVDLPGSYEAALELLEREEADLILEVPRQFERKLYREGSNGVFLGINAINGVKAGLGGLYINRIIRSFNDEIRQEWTGTPVPLLQEIPQRYWFNPSMNYRFFIVPGILGALITMLGGFLAALNIVREKEAGTIEQINVSPISRLAFILGKLIPFWVLGILVFTLGFGAIAVLIYGIRPVGSILLLYGFVALYMVAVLGLGLLISTYCETQQQAMSIGFFCMMIFMLMSGLFTPVSSMPHWAQWISMASPLTWFIEVIRSIVLKGSGFGDLKFHFMVIFCFGVLLNGWAVLNYKKTA